MLLSGWVIGLAGFLVTCVVAVFVAHNPPTYWSRVQVVFIAPKSTANPNGLLITPSSLIATAGVVSKMVDDTSNTSRVTSEGVTLAGEGIKHGYSVSLPNSGGQWANNYTQAQLDVQVIGTSAHEVASTMQHLLTRINQSLALIQTRSKVAKVNLIRTQASPPAIPLYRQDGSRVRALAATVALGAGLTAAAIALARRRRGPAPPATTVPQETGALEQPTAAAPASSPDDYWARPRPLGTWSFDGSILGSGQG